MPVFNAAEFVGAAIDSVLSQSFSDLELLIVNDGSTDGSEVLIASAAAADPRVRVLNVRHAGLVAALNTGLEHARGEFLARMDADDVSMPNRLTLQVTRLRRDPTLFAVGGQLRAIGGDGEDRGPLPRLPVGVEAVAAEIRAMRRCPLTQGASLIRTEALRRIGGYRVEFPHAEDLDMWLRAAEQMGLDNLTETVLMYRWHGNNVSLRERAQQAKSTWKAWTCARLRQHVGNDAALLEEDFEIASLGRLPLPRGEIQTIAGRYLFERLSESYMHSPAATVEAFDDLMAGVESGVVPRKVVAQLRFRFAVGFARKIMPIAAFRQLFLAHRSQPDVLLWAIWRWLRARARADLWHRR